MALNKGVIAQMFKKARGQNENIIIECKNLSKHRQQYIVFQIFDGQQKCKCVIEIQKAKKTFDSFINNHQTCKIIVRSYQVHDVKKKQNLVKVIQIGDFKIVNEPSIKKEFLFTQALSKIEDGFKTIRNQSIKQSLKVQSVKFQSTQNPNHYTKINKFPHSRPLLRLDSQSENEETLPSATKEIDIRGFQKIEDLYQGLYGWELLARVIEKSFREFVSKQNKQITILTIQLIDKVGFMIDATCFGEQATYLNSQIKVGGVYRISRGKVCEETYSNHKSDKYSKYIIKIGRETSLVPMPDFPQIPYNSNNFIRLSQITEGLNNSNFFNFVGILIKVEEEKTITKGIKQITMQNFKIGDPITNLVFDGIIWNRQIQIPEDFVNKSVILKYFKVNKYKDNLNLSATFRSQIIIHEHFSAYETSWKADLAVKKATQSTIKMLSELSEELKDIDKVPIMSEIVVWTNAICLGSKWYYDSCPKCRKTATEYNICVNCSFPVQQCKKRFLLSVELSDYTGSIYVTAFEDTASIFLNSITIEELLDMDEMQRKAFGDKFTFQSYYMKISSKKDFNGRITHHIVGKPEPLDAKVQAQANLELIQEYLRSINNMLKGLMN